MWQPRHAPIVGDYQLKTTDLGMLAIAEAKYNRTLDTKTIEFQKMLEKKEEEKQAMVTSHEQEVKKLEALLATKEDEVDKVKVEKDQAVKDLAVVEKDLRLKIAKAEATTKTAPGRLFGCGWDFSQMASRTFLDDFTFSGRYDQKCIPGNRCNITANDVVVIGMHGPCAVGNMTQLLQDFSGKALFINGESYGNVMTQSPSTSHHVYQLGPYKNEQVWQKNTMQLSFAVVIFNSQPAGYQEPFLEAVYNNTYKPKNTGENAAVAYLTSNCVGFRQAAAHHLAQILPVHYSSNGCHVNAPLAQAVVSSRDKRHSNIDLFHKYKCCLVMENRNYPGCITEKIILAFLGGCIPIYYGTADIFQLFHKDAFVYWDKDNPQPALEKIKRLEANSSEYHQMLHNAPILASPSVLQEYFSLADQVGGGSLKRKIRDMMQIE